MVVPIATSREREVYDTSHALLWHGSADSVLTLPTYPFIVHLGLWAYLMVNKGYGRSPLLPNPCIVKWRGSAASAAGPQSHRLQRVYGEAGVS